MKDRMLQFLIEIGKKNKAKAGLFGGIALLLVVGVFFVLPSFADETGDEPLAETVAEEEFEPTMEPEVTVKPLETEVPEATETEETAEPEEEKEPEESVEEEETGEETGESDPDVTPEVAAANEDEGNEPSEPVPADDGKVTSRPKKAAKAAPEQMQPPTKYEIVERPEGPFTYPLNDTTIKVKIEVTPPEGAGVEYQWYVSQQPNGTGEQLIGHGAQTSTYTLPSNTGAGTYYYYCMVRSVDNDGDKLPSEEKRSSDVVVTIAKGEPKIEYFDLSTIKNEYYYTGEFIDPKIVCSKEGMGNAYIVVKDGGTEIRPKAESDDPYSVYLHISEGANYRGDTIDLDHTMTIKRLPTPAGPYSISGKKGKLVDGKQWYTSEVKIVPKSGFLISENGIDFQNELVYSAEGTNQGPAKSVIYLQNKSNNGITDEITVAEKRDGKINIDQTKPTGTVSYNDASFDGVGHDYNGSYSKDEVVFNLAASDDESGVASCYYFWSKDIVPESQLAGKSWKPWTVGDTQPLNTEGTSILYAKVEDVAGNISYISTDRITIDKTIPEIICGTKMLGDTKSYVADRKKITVKDTYLKQVTVRRNGTVILTKSGDDIVAGSTSFRIERPDGVMEDVTYEITAEDEAGNVKTTSITLKNPVLDVDVAPLDFGSGENALVYGYESVEAQSISMTNKADGKPVVVDGLELELEERAENFFEIVDGTKIRPKQRLHVGTYTGAVRIYYNGEAESTTVCNCTVTVQQAPMLVSYTGQSDVGYHTLPDLTGTIEYAESDFKNGDTRKVFESDENFVAPKLYYREDDTLQEYTSDKRAMESMQLIPDGGSSSDYIFSYRGGDLEVRQHVLRNGYVIEGDKVDGYNWYVSDHVAIRPANGFQLSESQDPDSFAVASQLISVAGPTNGEEKSFYVMNNTTGEISALMNETIKIDNTAPFFREGEGITVSSNLWAEVCNAITFGIFFNNTKAVSIRATDEESGLESIQYSVSPAAIDGNSEDLESKLEWQQYDDGFSISPDEYERVIIYAKITNHAGLVTYASSDGMVFDNKQPDINKVEKGKEQSIIDGKEYITEELSLKVFDNNLEEAILYEGTSMSATGSALTITENEDHSRQAVRNIPCPSKGSKTYTVIARDSADNNTEREFTITKPIYDIVVDRLKIEETDYGYGYVPQTPVTWKNTELANADATISVVELSNNKDFEVKQSGDDFWIAAKKGLVYGNYTTDVTLVYNGGKKVETTCSFNVNKATLTAVFTGGDAYYHEKLGEKAEVKVTGFVRQNGVLETPETAAGYRAPTVEFDGIADETRELTPAGGKADNYKFKYKAGLLLVERRHAKSGNDGQYTIEGKISDTGWYTSDIIIRPKQGFVLSHTEEYDEPLESIVVTRDTDQGSETFYVTNETTGEIYYPVTFNYRKDCAAPEIQGIVPNATYEENSHGVVVEDDNLFSVTVNGKPQMVEHGRTRFNLTADQETMIYVVVAADIAGNMTDMTVILNQPGSLPVTDDSVVIPEQTPAPSSANEGNPGQVKKSVKVVQGAPDTSLTTSTAKLKTAVLSGDEQQAVNDGSKANIELRIRNIDSSVPQGDKELVIANLSDYTVGEYLDITLWKKVGSKSASKVTNINSPVTVTVTIPEELRSRSREFVIMRVHKGAVSVLEDQDSATNTVTFMTDRFSTYALAYKTVSSSSGTKSSTKRNTRSSTRSSASNGSSGFLGSADPVDASPETGDTAPLVPVSITFFAALAGIIVTMAVRRKAVK